MSARPRWNNSGKIPILVLAAGLSALSTPVLGQIRDGAHTDPIHGVEREATVPPSVGSCSQCHDMHALDNGDYPDNEPALFATNDNDLCFDTSGVGGCHNDQPLNYPLTEIDYLPDYTSYPGYPEANDGGETTHGVEYRGRWTGRAAYENTGQINGHDFSPHYLDADMPRRDAEGSGLCLNCHDPHGTDNPFDLLNDTYLNMGGHESFGAPDNYKLCFNCHGPNGPAGMNASGRLIQDFYDQSYNGDTSGHQIRRNPDIALSWPSYVQVGDKLPCYACHNPHGSRGASGAEPNAFLLNDNLPGWTGLTDPRNDAEQSRRVCFGCHIPSDGVPGSRTVLGIVMNTISDRGPHRSGATRSCVSCHGAIYDTPNSSNIHNQSSGPMEDQGEFWR